MIMCVSWQINNNKIIITKFSYYNNNKFTLYENRVDYCSWIWNKCCWSLNCSLSIWIKNFFNWLATMYSGRWCGIRHCENNQWCYTGQLLCPVLFVLYINSIAKVLPDSVTCLLFADDVKVYAVLKSDVDTANLQNALDRITDWSVKWQMPISVKKCSVIIYGNRATTAIPYCLCGSSLKSTDVVKYLGVTMNCH